MNAWRSACPTPSLRSRLPGLPGGGHQPGGRKPAFPDFPGIDIAAAQANTGGRRPLLLRVLKQFRDNVGKNFEAGFRRGSG